MPSSQNRPVARGTNAHGEASMKGAFLTVTPVALRSCGFTLLLDKNACRAALVHGEASTKGAFLTVTPVSLRSCGFILLPDRNAGRAVLVPPFSLSARSHRKGWYDRS